MEKAGQINGYQCQKCRKTIYTIIKDNGTTPFMVRCRICGDGEAYSMFYRIPQLDGEHVKYEWYRPSAEEVEQAEDAVKPALQQHVEQGGLVLRSRQEEGE